MRVLNLEDKVRRLRDRQEIENMMGRWEYLHAAGLAAQTAGFFAQTTPGVRIVNDGGRFVGGENVRAFVTGLGGGPRSGSLHLRTLTTAVIEIAADGDTAQGLWLSPGALAAVKQDGSEAQWSWIKLGVDFVRESGTWRIWHYRHYEIFTTSFDQPWRDVHAQTQPSPPTPYETWDELRSLAP
jgi:hypothetical protein